MTMSQKYGFRRGFINVPDGSHPSFALIDSTMTSEFGPAGTGWDFDVVEQVEGFTNVRIGVTTQDDLETVISHIYIGLLP